VTKKFVNKGSITKFTKILCHENVELYGTGLPRTASLPALYPRITSTATKCRY